MHRCPLRILETEQIPPVIRRLQDEPRVLARSASTRATCETESRPFQLSFPLSSQPFQAPRTGILPCSMLTSNRREAVPTPTPRASHRTRPAGPPVCVTKLPAIPATQTRQATYPRTRNHPTFRVLRHNAPPPSALS